MNRGALDAPRLVNDPFKHPHDGVSLERAEDLMPARLWAVVRPDCEAPLDRRAAGPPLDDISALVDEIERIGP